MDERRNPLASLTPDEIAFATSAFAAATASKLTFYDVTLHEPFTSAEKAAWSLKGDLSALPSRRAKIIASDQRNCRILEGDAPVSSSASSSAVFLREVRDKQPAITPSEYTLCERLIVEYEPFRAACRQRGFDPSDVRVDVWCVGWFDAEDNPSRRLAEPILFLQHGDASVDNLYMQPLEGFTLRVDLWADPPTIVSFDVDEAAPAPPPPEAVLRFPASAAAEAARPPLRPLMAHQPEGGSFQLSADGVLHWQRWEAVISFNSREGAVLSAVRYDGRPVAWRLCACAGRTECARRPPTRVPLTPWSS